MHTHTPYSLFGAIAMAPTDATIGINDMFVADSRPHKINLGVGVYQDADGKVPLLACVADAEKQIMATRSPRTYLPIEGLNAYSQAVQQLVLGSDSAIVAQRRAVTVQAVGGTGALKLGADFLKRFTHASHVWVSDPSWENHRALFETAGFEVHAYPYYDAATRAVDFDAMLKSLHQMPTGSVVLFHPCCHNPTGADLTDEQWQQVIEVVVTRALIPFIDMAYQGFGAGVVEDGRVVRWFAETGIAVFIANSFSKSFSLYGERVGALTIVTTSDEEAACVMSQLKRVIRTNYSNPPLHGGQIIATILNNAALRDLWQHELTAMRTRINRMRQALVKRLAQLIPERDFSFMLRQQGMFSYSGLNAMQVDFLREHYSIYAIATGRICIASINDNNIERVATAIAEAFKVK